MRAPSYLCVPLSLWLRRRSAEKGDMRFRPAFSTPQPSFPFSPRSTPRLRASALILLLPAILPAQGVIIDRIAVSVGNQVVTTSDVEREIRVAAFLNGTTPDLTPAARRAAAAQLVEQTLVRRDLETSRYPTPSPSEVNPIFDQQMKIRFPELGALSAALQAAGLTEQDVKAELLWQRVLLSFLDVRFRPAVQVSDAEVQDYFDKTVKPAAEAAHPGQPVSLDDYRDQIETALTGQKEDQELDRWLADAKKRTAIVYHEEVFQ